MSEMCEKLTSIRILRGSFCASVAPASLALCNSLWISIRIRKNVDFPVFHSISDVMAWTNTLYSMTILSLRRQGERRHEKGTRKKKSQKIEVIERENRVINVVAISLAAKQWKKREDSQWTTRRQEDVVFFAGSFNLLSLSHISLAFDQISVKRSRKRVRRVLHHWTRGQWAKREED